MNDEQLYELVVQELQQARENGYPFGGLPPEQIADDMNRYCPAVEGIETEKLVPHIKRWMEENKR